MLNYQKLYPKDSPILSFAYGLILGSIATFLSIVIFSSQKNCQYEEFILTTVQKGDVKEIIITTIDPEISSASISGNLSYVPETRNGNRRGIPELHPTSPTKLTPAAENQLQGGPR